MAVIRYSGSDPVHLGTTDGPLIEPDELVTVEGELEPEQPLEDAYVIGDRAYPKALWRLEDDGTAAAVAPAFVPATTDTTTTDGEGDLA